MQKSKLKANPRGAIKATVHPSGKITLSGVNVRDLKAILTSASLWRHQEKEKTEINSDGKAWHARVMAVLGSIEKAVDLARFGERPHPKTKAERWAAAKELRRENQWFAEVMESCRQAAAEAKAVE